MCRASVWPGTPSAIWSPPAGCGRSSSASVPTAPWAQQEQHQDHRRAGGLPRSGATSSTTPRSRARAPSPTCALAPSPSMLPGLSSRRGFIGCHQWGFVESVDLLEHAAEGRPCCSMLPEPDRSGPSCPSGCVPASAPSISASTASMGSGGRAQRYGQSHQHHHADLLLRAGWHLAAG